MPHVTVNKIAVKDYSSIRLNVTASAVAINPGMLLEWTSGSLVQAHNSAGETLYGVMVAQEDENQGKGISDAYAASALINVGIFRSGDEVVLRLANGQNASIGSLLESDGAGALNVHALGSALVVESPQAIVGYALEAVDMSDSSAADPSGLILVRII